jgi:hypothetical protein
MRAAVTVTPVACSSLRRLDSLLLTTGRRLLVTTRAAPAGGNKSGVKGRGDTPMMDAAMLAAVQDVHASPTKAVFAAAGGGSLVRCQSVALQLRLRSSA